MNLLLGFIIKKLFEISTLKNALPIYEEFNKVISDAWSSKEVKDYIHSKVNKNEIYDIEILGSGIEASDYIDTVKFMFLSKEGIRLPDINGKIKEELICH